MDQVTWKNQLTFTENNILARGKSYLDLTLFTKFPAVSHLIFSLSAFTLQEAYEHKANGFMSHSFPWRKLSVYLVEKKNLMDIANKVEQFFRESTSPKISSTPRVTIVLANAFLLLYLTGGKAKAELKAALLYLLNKTKEIICRWVAKSSLNICSNWQCVTGQASCRYNPTLLQTQIRCPYMEKRDFFKKMLRVLPNVLAKLRTDSF